MELENIIVYDFFIKIDFILLNIHLIFFIKYKVFYKKIE